MLFLSEAHACFFSFQQGDDLYDVFNTFFLNGTDQTFSSDIELLNSSYFISNDQDTLWMSAGDVLRVEATYSDSLFRHELGYVAGGDYICLVGRDGIEKQRYTSQDVTFSLLEGAVWTDTIGFWFDDPIQQWYADAAMNDLGGKDHFLAFAIENNDLLAVFNEQYDTNYSADRDDVWMIAFEDLNLGDADYNDLVAVIARPENLNAVPLPASALLFMSALGGMALLYKKRTNNV
jgi:hypothetical protein